LLRAFVSQFNRWDQLWKFKYDSNKDNWKEILKIIFGIKPIQKVIDIESIDDIINLPIKESDFKDNQKKIHEDLYRSELLTVIQDSCYLQLYYETYILYPYNAKADWKKYVIGNKRNNLLSKLIQQKVIISDNQLKNNEGSIPFFWGWNVNFVFQERSLYGNMIIRLALKAKCLNFYLWEYLKKLSLLNLSRHLSKTIKCPNAPTCTVTSLSSKA
jgi:hypothetical protein